MLIKQKDINKMILMKKEGYSQQEISDKTGHSLTIIKEYCKSIKRKQLEIDEIKNIQKMRREGFTHKEICNNTGHFYTLVNKHCKGISSEKITICKRNGCNNLVYPKQGNGNRRKYCSAYCRTMGSNKRVYKRLCKGCGITFETKTKSQQYHNRECNGKSKQTNINRVLQCVICGDKYIPTTKDQMCCGPKCSSEKGRRTRWERGTFKYPYTKKGQLARRRGYENERSKNDKMWNLNKRMGCGMWLALKGNKRGRKWETLVDYTVYDLQMHLEKLFKENMSWENMGDWHIDHIKPKNAFNYENAEDKEFQDCWALNNLQPLWAEKNMSKGAKWNGDR